MSWFRAIPYNRVLSAFLDFVNDVTDPYLNLFRRFIPMVRLGPGRARPEPDRRDVRAADRRRDRRRADPRVSLAALAAGAALAVVGVTVAALDQVTKADRVASLERGEERQRLLRARPHQRAQHGRGVRRALGRRTRCSSSLIALALGGLLAYFALRATTPWLWLPVGLIVGGALGNLADRAREGAVIDFIDPIAVARVQRRGHGDRGRGARRSLYVVGGAAVTRAARAGGARRTRPASGSTSRSAALAEVGSRAAAQRLIEAGAVTVDGAPRPKRHRLAAGRAGRGRAARAADPADPSAGEGVPFEVVLEDDDLMVVDKPAGVVVHPAPGHATGTLAQALAGRAAGGPSRGGRGSSTASTATPPGCWWWRSRTRVTARSRSMIRSAGGRREYLALVDGPPGRPHGHDRRPDRPRPRRPHAHVDAHRQAARGADPLRDRGGVPAHDAAARAARDRAHPPDPRPPGGDRPSGLRRSASTAGRHAAGGLG